MRIYHYLIILFLFVSCSTKHADIGNKNNESVIYDVHVNYIDEKSRPNSTDKYIQSDSLYLFFENGFVYSKAEVYLNGQQEFVTDSLFTSLILGLADTYIFGSMETIKSVGIRIDNGRLMLIEPFKGQNIWRINYRKQVLTANYAKHCPNYD